MATTCALCETSLDDVSDDEIYLLRDKAIAQNNLRQYRGQGFCRRCMFRFAAENNLVPDEDFLTKNAVSMREESEKTRNEAFRELVEYVDSLNLLPDIRGKPPMLGDKQVCRVCAEPCSPDELYTFHSKFTTWLNPELTPLLYRKVFCEKHFEELQNKINEIAEKNNIKVKLMRGKTFLTLRDVFNLNRKKRELLE